MKNTIIIVVLIAIFCSVLLIGCAKTQLDEKTTSLPHQNPPLKLVESENANADNGLVGENLTNEEQTSGESTEKSNQQEGVASTEQEIDTFVRFDILLRAKVDGLNVRAEPTASSKSLGSLTKGQYVSFQEENNGWYTTYYKQKIAYVSASYCEVVQFSLGDEKTESIINEGKMLLGYPYIWGSQRYHWGNGKLNTNFKQGEFDCSALTQYIYYKGADKLLGLTTREQVLQGLKINRQEIQRGDLLFFTNASRKHLTGIERVGHVAVYLGENTILHTASDYACIEPISTTRWSYFISASRF